MRVKNSKSELKRKKKLKMVITLLMTAGVLLLKNRKKRMWWMKPWLTAQRGNIYIYEEFVRAVDLSSFRNFLRMDEKTFLKLYEKVEMKIKKQDTILRLSIPAKHKLILTLRFLATGESYTSLMYNYRISLSSISEFVPLVCAAIYEELKEDYLKVPNTVEEWLTIAEDFNKMWNLPNIVGALDGKHIIIKAPAHEGSSYFNYKNQHSIVLLALVDSNYKFTYINVGMNGRLSDGGVYWESSLSKGVEKNLLNIPQDKPLPGRQIPVPHMIVADAAFALSNFIMKPYPLRNLTKEQRILNYRLSRVRRVSENAFGILANRFRVLLNISQLSPEKSTTVTLACCTLHNFLRTELHTAYTGNPDLESDPQYQFAHALRRTTRNRPTNEALTIREEFKEYVNGVGSVSWQDAMV